MGLFHRLFAGTRESAIPCPPSNRVATHSGPAADQLAARPPERTELMTSTDVIMYAGLIAFALGTVVALHGWTNRSAAPMLAGLAMAVPAGVLSLLMLRP